MITATMVVATVPVTDLERAKKFYGDTLGLTFLWETAVAVRYRCGTPARFPCSGARRSRRSIRLPTSKWTISRP